MKFRCYYFGLLILALNLSCSSHVSYSPYYISTVDNNVCKKLSGEVLLYAIFVDSRYTQPWSEYDIRSTLDSIKKMKVWLEKNAKENGIPLDISISHHQNGRTIPIAQNLAHKTLSGTLFSPFPSFGIPKLDRWSNIIAKTAGTSLPKDTSKIVKTPNRLTDRERLIARLRDIYKTDNVAVMYFINDYYSEDLSLALYTGRNDAPEYAIVSFKKPAVIAHEFLHLFGALDLYISPFERKKKNIKRLALINKEFPREIMAFAHRQIDSLDISPLTKYLIGWQNELDEKTRQLVLGNIKVAKY
ncbi:MAG: hypothetical protein EOP48_28975 [Sphingobacteriales bacterium]|nr:MAG: hypothetical protein EOP48_28975 [Sphingobacteriales bacterium]